MKAYKFRIYPNKEQIEKLEFALDTCRQAYNILLSELNDQVVIDRNMIQATLPDLKICEPRFKDIYSKTLQYECYRLFSNLSALKALKQNKKKVGRLRFKGKGWFKTINYNQSGFTLDSKNKKLSLSKIGNIKIKLHRIVEGNIKQVTIKKSIDKWYVTLITDAIIKTKCGKKIIGIDLGIQDFIVDSENNVIKNPLNYTSNLTKIKKAHKNLSRKKKGSNNRKKAKIKLSKIYEKINNSRDDFLHKTSTDLIRKSKIIVLEKLNIKQMMEQKYFNAKNIADSSWGKFVQFLTYKAESAGCEIVKIDPKNTSKMCSNCGSLQDMPLWKRTYECENCGIVIQRDYNSAINILNKFSGSERACVEINPSVSQGLSLKQEATSFR